MHANDSIKVYNEQDQPMIRNPKNTRPQDSSNTGGNAS